jgi:tocopherol O-methyltransferase
MMRSTVAKIVDYYDTCESDYRRFWDLDRSMAMHAGFWDHQTASLSEALARENEILAGYAAIKPHEKVLDAGCGIGGSSLFLAKHYGCEVTGITLSAHQVDVAKINAQKQGLETRVHFEVMDFCETHFPDASFDVIWGIESICHAQNKENFAQEAYRLLKKGGRLIIADGFATPVMNSKRDQESMHHWLNGWGVDHLDSKEVFQKHLMRHHFDNITYTNTTSLVMPSSKRLYWISFPGIVWSKMGEWLGVRKKIQTNNLWAAYYQYQTLKKGLWEYGIFRAYKL